MGCGHADTLKAEDAASHEGLNSKYTTSRANTSRHYAAECADGHADTAEGWSDSHTPQHTPKSYHSLPPPGDNIRYRCHYGWLVRYRLPAAVAATTAIQR